MTPARKTTKTAEAAPEPADLTPDASATLIESVSAADLIAATDPTNLLVGYLDAEQIRPSAGPTEIVSSALQSKRLVVNGVETPSLSAPVRERLQAWLKLFLSAVEEEHEIEVREVAIHRRGDDTRLRIAATDGSFRSVEFEA